MKIKEKVLKEELLNQRENENIRYPLDEYWFRTGFDVAWDKFLAEVGKVIDDWKFELVGMLNMKAFHNKEIEVPLDIEDIEELKQKLGIK